MIPVLDTWLSSLVHEMRLAPRRLFRHPAFWLPALATLALGIGAVAAVFAVLDAVVLRPLPYPAPDRLVRLQSAVPETGGEAWGLGKSELLYFQRSTRSFQALGLYLIDRSTVGARPAAGEPARQVYAAAVSAGVARTLGIRPLLGRAMTARDNRAGAPPAVWLSHGFWARGFGRDPAIVGRVIPLDGRPVQVAGVLPPEARLPEELQGLDLRVDLWTPLRLDPADPPAASHRFRALGRLWPDVSRTAAAAELSRLTARLPAVLPEAYTSAFLRQTGFTTELVPLRDDVLGGEARTLWILLGAVALLLVVANANVANLVLAQAETDHPELALRAALGATRGRLILQTSVEAWPLVLLVTAASAFLAYGAVRLLLAFPPADLPRLTEIRLGGRELLLTLALSALGGALYALLPLTRRDLGSELLGASCCRTATIPPGRRAARDVLVVAQVAFSLMLVAAAALLLRSFHRLSGVEPGFSTRDVLTFHVVLPRSRYGSPRAATLFYRRLAARTASLPGARDAGLTTALPLTGFDGCSSVYAETRPLAAGEQPLCAPVLLVSPGYFQALDIPLLRGSAPQWADLETRAPLAVVSEGLARRLWPGRDPLGRGVRTSPQGPPYRVIGVVRDVRANGLDQPSAEALYLPLTPATGAESPAPLDMAVVARTAGRPLRLAEAVRKAVLDLDPGVPVTEVRSMRQILRASMARSSFSTLLLGVCSGLAIAFAALGIYSLLTFLIARRQREIGIRMALGAGRLQAGGMVVRQSLLLTALGVALGLGGAFFGADSLRSLLFEVDPADPATLAGAALLLFTVAAAASLLPAWRAAHVQPHEALQRS